GITLLVFLNLGSVYAIIKEDIYIGKWTFMLIALSFYLIISFVNPKLNDKEFVKNYKTIEVWKKVSIGYIITSIIMFILTFWIFVIVNYKITFANTILVTLRILFKPFYRCFVC